MFYQICLRSRLLMRLGRSHGESRTRTPSSGERWEMLSINHHALSHPLSHHHR